ncbi:MAG: ribokinase [Myxococcota bacterium]|jgi:ribokinase|nr:ribokinase [Myxococcota bacterium]
MSLVNFGSINLDFVYRVQALVRPGETVQSLSLERFAGGKGFNQSLALARAGAEVRHVGSVGEDGRWLVEMLATEGVDIRNVEVVETPTGHAIIQVSARGENSILVHAGANRELSGSQLERACVDLGDGDWVLLQNETNAPEFVLAEASKRGFRVILNPSPLDSSLLDLPLDRVDTFLVNEVEGEALAGEADPDRVLGAMRKRFPAADIVLTRGEQGAAFSGRDGTSAYAGAESVEVIDTTGAGDTFAGFYLAALLSGANPQSALVAGCRAAAHCVSRPGAAPSIPRVSDL